MGETPPTPPAPNGRPRLWIRLILFASLALNLLVAGVVAGTLLTSDKREDRRTDKGLGKLSYVRALSQEDRRELGAQLRNKFQKSGRLSRDPARFDAAIALLLADPFDQAAFAEVLEAQFTSAEARHRMGREALSQYLAQMSLEDRKAYVARLRDILEKRRKKPKP